MTGEVEVPFEAGFASDAAVMELRAREPQASDATVTETAVKAAAPFIRSQERQQVREALQQPIHDLATHLGRGRMEIHDLDDPPAAVAARSELELASDAMQALRAALNSLEGGQ
jgi:hypothetical protein